MRTQRLSRPSLKVTRRVEDGKVSDFSFEVWSPFVGTYQPVPSMEQGLQRVDELAKLIRQMSIQRHPKQDALMDVPDAGGYGSNLWAEFRINATAHRSYDTRRRDRTGWVKAVGLNEAADATCAKVGYDFAAAKATAL
jgi:hypothetical protein